MPPLKKYHLNDEEACSGTHSVEIQLFSVFQILRGIKLSIQIVFVQCPSILKLTVCQNQFHVKSDRKKILQFPHCGIAPAAFGRFKNFAALLASEKIIIYHRNSFIFPKRCI